MQDTDMTVNNGQIDLNGQLITLRGITQSTGALHETQILQLKLWPMVVLTNAVSSEFAFSWEERSITFDIKIKGKLQSDHKVRLEYLDEWVKFLLGGDYLVKVKVRGKQVFRGLRKTQPPPKPSNGVPERISWRDRLVEDEE